MVAITDFSAMITTDHGQPRPAAEAVYVLTPARAASPAFLQTTGPCQSCEVVPPLLRPTGMPLGSASDEFQRPISEIVPSSSWAPLDAKKAEVSRWWTQAGGNLVCPLSGLPIKLLPYPPFKMRSDPAKPRGPQVVLDGKLLALHLIADGTAPGGTRPLVFSDIQALDLYIQRCKLGPWRPGRAQRLAINMISAPTQARRDLAAAALEKLQYKARSELRKLRLIQESRISRF